MTDKTHNQAPEWGSDVVAQTLRDLDLRYVALNPGASYRGIHDSLVNFTGNDPEILLCVHEEAAVAIAHGWAKVTGRPMTVALHSNVGLMHGSMGIFNAFCDRVPMVVIGATGPVDAARRRPWIEWIHTAQDQGALVRDFIKWDDQPGSIAAARDALIQGTAIAATAPRGPVYINIDAALQEEKVTRPLADPDIARRGPPAAAAPAADLVDRAAAILKAGLNIVFMMGRMSRDLDDWNRRIALAEHLGARVIADFKTGSTFPTNHKLTVGHAGYFPDPDAKAALAEADVIVNFDWLDFGGTLRSVFPNRAVPAKIVSASLDSFAHRGWSKDGGAHYPADVSFLNEPDQVVHALAHALEAREATNPGLPPLGALPEGETLTPQDIALLLRSKLDAAQPCLIRGPLSWTGADWPVDHPLGALGYDGGGGIGSGSGMAVGAALALRDTGSDRLPLAVLGDGDFLMNASALWTGINKQVPLLVVVLNNRSFYNDEVHQETVAKDRDRPVENKHVGIVMNGPDIDVSSVARGFGAWSPGLIKGADALVSAMEEALSVVKNGGTAVLEVDTAKGYAPSMANALRAGS
ncbi:thiamine pyrophosphate-binding protein [Chelativorans sp. AA-79]|uniref:thiamine pyrophosphate-binding protein n=1 Tax=Chelativorans sp. AA-79 TaxID=3028735 RepID=UPI0023F81EAC|nr:thiamine pyrophosphate-binding protein [Chelativorans sp. AA-79]WEX10884.1 thiamine pyrophosphate-binding protein [Chelativorans sp. AA-79]